MFPNEISRPGLYCVFLVLLGTMLLSSCEKESLLSDPLKNEQQIDAKNAFADGAMEIPAQFESSETAMEEFSSKYQEKYEQAKALKERYLDRLQQENITPRSTSPQTLFVPNDYPSLQTAVDATNPGDEIVITQNLSDQGTVVMTTPGITIRSNENMGFEVPAVEVIILADDITISNLRFELQFAIVVDNVTGLVFRNSIAYSQQWAGMFMLASSGCKIENSQFSGFDSGMLVLNSDENQFTANSFTLNADPGFLVGPMAVFASSKNTIKNCRVDGNNANESYGFWMANSSNDNVLMNCTSSNNGIAGFTLISSKGNKFTGCKVSSSSYGFVIWGSDYHILRNCRADNLPLFAFALLNNGGDRPENNLLENCKGTNSNVGVYMDGTAFNTIANGEFSGNVRGIQNQYGQSNTIRGAKFIGNSTAGVRLFATEESTVRDCVMNENGGAGIWATFAAGAQLQKNNTNENDFFGVLLQDCIGTTISKSNAHNNVICDIQIEGDPNEITLENNNLSTYCPL